MLLRSTLLSWIPINSWTIAYKINEHNQRAAQLLLRNNSQGMLDIWKAQKSNIIVTTWTWYVHWFNNGVTGSSLRSTISNKGEISVRLKSKRPLSCWYISFCIPQKLLTKKIIFSMTLIFKEQIKGLSTMYSKIRHFFNTYRYCNTWSNLCTCSAHILTWM